MLWQSNSASDIKIDALFSSYIQCISYLTFSTHLVQIKFAYLTQF